jgi:TonB family protein
VRNKVSIRRPAHLLYPSRAFCFALISFLILTTPTAPALHAQTDSHERKLVYRVEPEYPADLKRVGIGGYVRVDATVSSTGAVEGATVTGGNPILGEAAVRAIRKWKYEPMGSRTKVKLVVHFSP